VALLDYTCQGCRVLHDQLQQAQQTFPGQFFVVSLPAPLEGACNPTVTEAYPDHANACAYARLALEVWQADRAAFPTFEQWIWVQSPPPSPDETRRFARTLVPALNASGSNTNASAEAQLAQGVAIYSAVHAQLGRHAMPLLLVGTNISMGSFPSTEDLC